MSNSESQWRTPPEGILAEASATSGGWVYEIDTAYVDDPNGYVPPEAVSGGWKVDDAGRPTGEYRPNPRHGPPQDDLAPLATPDHWLGWLGADPARVIRDSIEGSLAEQVAGARVDWLKITAEPQFLTGGRRDPENLDKVHITRAALAVQFALSVVQPEGRRDILTGVFSVARVDLDQTAGARQQSWLDLGTKIDDTGRLLEQRIYSLDNPN